MGLIKGFWIIVDLGKNVSYQVAWQEYSTIGIFFSSKYSTNYEQRSQYCGTLSVVQVLFSRVLSNIVNEFFR